MIINFCGLPETIKIEPYKSWQEKEILLIENYIEDTDCIEALDIALNILKVPEKTINKLTDDDKKALLLKFREISVSNIVDVKFKCVHCGMPNDETIDISDVIHKAKLTSDKVKNLYRKPENELDLIKNFIRDDVSITELNAIKANINDYLTYYNFTLEAKCIHCQKVNKIDVSSPRFILNTLSEDSLQSMYQNYHALSFFGNWSKGDIDNLYPFERQIFISMLKQSLDEKAKAQNNARMKWS